MSMQATGEEPGSGRQLRSLCFPPGYDSGDDILNTFYVPVLRNSVSYDRSVGYFRSSSLSAAARGMSRFVSGGGTVRLLVGAELTETDAEALQGNHEIPPGLAARLAAALATDSDIDRQRLAVLAWLVQEGRLQLKVAVPVGEDGAYLVGDQDPFFHEKIGVLRDGSGAGVAFQGSVNESATAWTRNFESFSVFTSWGEPNHFEHWSSRFEQRWAGNVPGYRVLELPEAVREELLRAAPVDAPPERDPEEESPVAEPALLARYLEVAPKLPTAQGLPEATSPIAPFPHQRQVYERLAGTFPRSWLLADEVGLGKTISAGLSLRRLVLTGEVERALILAPANVARQWQDELFEKFGLWVPRLESRRLHGAHPDDVRPLEAGENPYMSAPILIASSHLARRRDHRSLMMAAAPFDLLVVDEAHHARRRSFADPTQYRPSLLLSLLDDLREAGKLRTTWLLTATPMQVAPIELLDLLRQVGLTGRLASWAAFQQFYAELAKDETSTTDWRAIVESLRGTPLPESGLVEEELLRRIRNKLGPVATDRIARFIDSPDDPREVARGLEPAGRAELREWLRLRSPVGQYVTRHSRVTLKRYRDEGLLTEPVADRDVEDVDIIFGPTEKELYERLDSLIDRLLMAHGSKQQAGFVLTVYRRRLTSSWAAIRRTLHKRLAREGDFATQLELDADILDEIDSDTLLGDGIDEETAVPLDAHDLEEIREYLHALESVPDAKFDVLTQLIGEARAEGRALVVFTQFTDTLESIRDRLVGAYGPELATYTGQGGRRWDPSALKWQAVSKQQLVADVRDGRVTVILANDAASEGLNLQAASFLINYDLPWNPMRVEQRIGRVDRIGQQWATVKVRNFTIPGTVEVDVYRALHGRIAAFHDLVGKLQPILGATEKAVRDAYSSDRSHRREAVDEQVRELLAKVDELEAGGIDLADEDPLPLPNYPPSPVTQQQLDAAINELGIQLAEPGRPVISGKGASRDATDWRALGTYGHPRLQAGLAALAAGLDEDRLSVVIHETPHAAVAIRADRSPPEAVSNVDDLRDLGAAYARDDAADEAQRLLEDIASERRAVYEAVRSAGVVDQRDALRTSFTAFVRDLIATRTALRLLTTGDSVDPAVVWFDLREEQNVLRYVEAAARSLELPTTELFPSAAEVKAHSVLSAKKLQAEASNQLSQCEDLFVQLRRLAP